MSYLTFTTSQPPLVQGTTEKTECRTLSAGFGDGYGQESGDGVNSVRRIWPCSWKLPLAEAAEKRAFLAARGGYEPFWWTPPRESTPILVKCKSWDRGFPSPSRDTLSATFVEAFEL